MATDFIAVDTQRSYDSASAKAAVEVGTPVVRETDGVRPLDVSSDSGVEDFLGYAAEADHNLRYEHEFGSYSDLYTYEPASAKPDEDYDDLVEGIIPLMPKDVVRAKTIEDTSEPEPSFEEGEEVGFIDLGNGPRLVPAGYTDNGATQYGNGGGGDFVSFGVVDVQAEHKVSRSGYNELIPVRVQ